MSLRDKIGTKYIVNIVIVTIVVYVAIIAVKAYEKNISFKEAWEHISASLMGRIFAGTIGVFTLYALIQK